MLPIIEQYSQDILYFISWTVLIEKILKINEPNALSKYLISEQTERRGQYEKH